MGERVIAKCIKTSAGRDPVFIRGTSYYIIDKRDEFVWVYGESVFVGKWSKDYFYDHYAQYFNIVLPEQQIIIEKFRAIKTRLDKQSSDH